MHEPPGWLQTACERIADREQFSKGPRQRFRLAGRCSSLVARVARQTLNKTPSEIVNDARLSWAAIPTGHNQDRHHDDRDGDKAANDEHREPGIV